MTKRARHFIIENVVSLTGGNENQSSRILPQISDGEIDRLYDMMSKIDANQSRFTGSKREYVLAVYKRLSSYMTHQTLNGVGVFKPIRMIGGITTGDPLESEVEKYKSEYKDKSTIELISLRSEAASEVSRINDIDEDPLPEEDIRFLEELHLDAKAKLLACSELLKEQETKKTQQTVEPESGIPIPESVAAEKPTDTVQSAIYNAYIEEAKKFDSPEDREKLIRTLSVPTIKKEEMTRLKTITSDVFAKQMADNIMSIRTGVKFVEKGAAQIEQGKLKSKVIISSPIDDIVSNHISTIEPHITFKDISTLVSTYQPFAKGLLEDIVSEEPQIMKSNVPTFVGKNLLNFTLYPKLTNFDEFNGEATLCRRFIIKGQRENGEQAKLGEFRLRSQFEWMNRFGFKKDQYNLAELAVKQTLLESDIMDLQEFETIGGDTYLRVGEIKTYSPESAHMEYQYTKQLFYVHMLSEYEKRDSDPTYRPCIRLRHIDNPTVLKTYYFPITDVTSTSYPYVPFVLNMFNTNSYYKKNVDAADAMPKYIVYDALKLAEQMKNLKWNEEVVVKKKKKTVEVNMFDKMLKETIPEDYFRIGRDGRITTMGTGITTSFERYKKKAKLPNINIQLKKNDSGEVTGTSIYYHYQLINPLTNGFRKEIHDYKRKDGTISTSFNQLAYDSFINVGTTTSCKNVFPVDVLASYKDLGNEFKILYGIPKIFVAGESETITSKGTSIPMAPQPSNYFALAAPTPGKLLQRFSNIIGEDYENPFGLKEIQDKWVEYKKGLSEKKRNMAVGKPLSELLPDFYRKISQGKPIYKIRGSEGRPRKGEVLETMSRTDLKSKLTSGFVPPPVSAVPPPAVSAVPPPVSAVPPPVSAVPPTSVIPESKSKPDIKKLLEIATAQIKALTVKLKELKGDDKQDLGYTLEALKMLLKGAKTDKDKEEYAVEVQNTYSQFMSIQSSSEKKKVKKKDITV